MLYGCAQNGDVSRKRKFFEDIFAVRKVTRTLKGHEIIGSSINERVQKYTGNMLYTCKAYIGFGPTRSTPTKSTPTKSTPGKSTSHEFNSHLVNFPRDQLSKFIGSKGVPRKVLKHSFPVTNQVLSKVYHVGKGHPNIFEIVMRREQACVEVKLVQFAAGASQQSLSALRTENIV